MLITSHSGTSNVAVRVRLAHLLNAALEAKWPGVPPALLWRTSQQQHDFLPVRSLQFSVVILLLLRATSLLRTTLEVAAQRAIGRLRSVRRRYLETWLLAFQDAPRRLFDGLCQVDGGNRAGGPRTSRRSKSTSRSGNQIAGDRRICHGRWSRNSAIQSGSKAVNIPMSCLSSGDSTRIGRPSCPFCKRAEPCSASWMLSSW